MLMEADFFGSCLKGWRFGEALPFQNSRFHPFPMVIHTLDGWMWDLDMQNEV